MSQESIDLLWSRIRDPESRTLVENLGIQIDHIDEKSISGTMPVDERTIQYYGMLHGGASVAFAESLASLGALVHVDHRQFRVVGQEINANHLRPMTAGRVKGVGRPLYLGRHSQVWSIEITNDAGKLVCVSRCTIAVIPAK